MNQHKSLQEALNRFLSGEFNVIQDQDVTKALPPTILKLIETEKKQVAEKLIEQLIAGLGQHQSAIRLGCGRALTETATLLVERKMWPLLEKLDPSLALITQGTVGDGLTEDIRQAAARALDAARTRGGEQPAPLPTDVSAEKKDPLAIREEQIFNLARTGNQEEAKKQLFDLVVSCAKRKDFKNAERLRERIYEIDPMALTEIIQSGEIIEEQKIDTIGRDLLQVWSKLLKVLNQEEFNSLYHSMEELNINRDDTLVAQGEKNDELFFINRGSLRVSYLQTGMGGEKELLVKNLSSGEIAGENFFNATVWTVSLVAMQPTNLSVLRRDALARLEQTNPGIESKLRDFYNQSSDIAKLLNKKGLDRRIHDRFTLERKISLQILGEKGKILGSFKAEMSDISLGGLSFIIRITKKENSRLLLGRNIKAEVPLSSGGMKKLHGSVIGVQVCDLIHSDYSVHVKFDDELEKNSLRLIME